MEAADLSSIAQAAPHSTPREMIEEADRNLLIVIKEMREGAKVADEHEAPGTVDMFSKFVQVHEKHEWWLRDMLRNGDGLTSWNTGSPLEGRTAVCRRRVCVRTRTPTTDSNDRRAAGAGGPRRHQPRRRGPHHGPRDQAHDTVARQPTLVRGLKNRAFVVKINRLMRF